jgi:hypothetical protein
MGDFEPRNLHVEEEEAQEEEEEETWGDGLDDEEWEGIMAQYPLEADEDLDDGFKECDSWAVFTNHRPKATRRIFDEVIGIPPHTADVVWMKVCAWWTEKGSKEPLKSTMLDLLWLLSYLRIHPTLQQAAFLWRRKDGKGPGATTFKTRIVKMLALARTVFGSVRS